MNGGIINYITRLHLVGYFYWVILQCTDLWILKVYYRIQTLLRFGPVINQVSPTHNLINYLFRIYSNIIFSFRPSSSKWCEYILGNSYCLLLNLLNGLKCPSWKTVTPSAAKYKTHHTSLHRALELTTKVWVLKTIKIQKLCILIFTETVYTYIIYLIWSSIFYLPIIFSTVHKLWNFLSCNVCTHSLIPCQVHLFLSSHPVT